MTSRILSLVVICAVTVALFPSCAKTPKTACENIIKIAGEEVSEEKIKECYGVFFNPIRGAGEVDEAPHIECYNAAKTKEDVEKCLAEVMKVALTLPGSDAAKAAAEAAAVVAEEAAASAKAVALEGCVTKCSAEVPEVTDPKYAECMTACKTAAGL
jgi:hypothetical protein